jgi:hypothetical protein
MVAIAVNVTSAFRTLLIMASSSDPRGLRIVVFRFLSASKCKPQASARGRPNRPEDPRDAMAV